MGTLRKINFLFWAPVVAFLLVLTFMTDTQATDNINTGSYATAGEVTTMAWTVLAASTTMDSAVISVVGKSKVWLNVYIETNNIGSPVHVGAVTRPIWIEGKPGLSSTATVAYASTWIPYFDDVSSATTAAARECVSREIPDRLGLYGPIDVDGLSFITVHARGIAEASDVEIELSMK